MQGNESAHTPQEHGSDPNEQVTGAVPPTPQGDAPDMAEEAIRQTTEAVGEIAEDIGEAVPIDLKDFQGAQQGPGATTIGMLGDVDLDVRIELGRTQMLVEDVLKLTPDSVVELDKAAGDPVDIYVNGRHVARGEVLVLNENFCVRVSEIIGKVNAGSESA